MARTIKDNTPPWQLKLETKRAAKGNIQFKNIFRIYCEGKNTEPAYFNAFPINTSEYKVEEVVGLGRQRTNLVMQIIEKVKHDEIMHPSIDKGKYAKNYDEIRQIWCVFDMDTDASKGKDVVNNDFDNAIKLAKKHHLKVAYSNDSFELWLVLHFKYLKSKWTRKEYYNCLTKELNIKNYEENGKTKAFCNTLYVRLLKNQFDAIKNAKKLATENIEILPSLQCPLTTVYELVEQLNISIRK